MKIIFTSSFLKRFNVLPENLKEEVIEKTELFKDSGNHRLLKVHKLHGQLRGNFSFSINYRIRVVFSYLSDNEVVFHSIGDHKIYQ